MKKVVWLIMLTKILLLECKKLEPAERQIVDYRDRTYGIVSNLTNSAGQPIEYKFAINSLNTNLITHRLFLDLLQHFDRERIPTRVVHAKGGGAFGYFKVTDDVTDICKADFLKKVGKITPVAVRFSPTIVESGGIDTDQGTRGFAVKFYTTEGNFDMVGLSIPHFAIKDPLFFPSLIRAQKRNPVTHLRDPIMFWDFLTLRPESFNTFLKVFGGLGIPNTYRHMPGFSIHTYQVVNNYNESYFIRFHLIPDAGLKYFSKQEGMDIGAKDPDYNNRDLYNAIAKGNYPSWTVSLQVLSLDDVNNAEFDVFDVTRELPLDKYPLRKIGTLVLKQNPRNYFADVEQLAFCPSNFVPGIIGSPGKLFEARVRTYKDAQNYRLGINFNKIPVNCPFRAKPKTYNRDGVSPIDDNEDGAPNYFPNSFNGPMGYDEKNSVPLLEVVEKPPYNFDQTGEFYNRLTDDERESLIENLVSRLLETIPEIQERAVKYFTIIDAELGYRVQKGLQTNHAFD